MYRPSQGVTARSDGGPGRVENRNPATCGLVLTSELALPMGSGKETYVHEADFESARQQERRGMSTLSARAGWLPTGHGLPPDVWARRHRSIVLLLWTHAVGLALFGLVRGFGLDHALVEGGVVAALAAIASWSRLGARIQTATATFGLISASAVLVHLSGGVIESHFHFFAMVGIITLYQDWMPFGLAIAFVAIHHGLASTFDPHSVYNHSAALNNPWKWALIHGLFVLGASAANLFAWRLNEDSATRAQSFQLRLAEAERRRQSALEINDNVVQGLAVVTSALALGEDRMARETAEKTLRAAQAIITDLLGDAEDMQPGALRRESAASAG